MPRVKQPVTQVVTPASIAAHIGKKKWIQGQRIQQGVFHHALVCARRGDTVGLDAFCKLSPKEWWVALLSPKARERAEQMISAPFEWTAAESIERQFDQLLAVSLAVPDLAAAANTRIVEGLLERTEIEIEDELDLDRAFLHLVETDLARAKQASPWLEMVDDQVTALVEAVGRSDDAALESVVALWAAPDLTASLTAEQWQRIAPKLVGKGHFTTVNDLIDAVAKSQHPALAVGPPNVELIRTCWRLKELARMKQALESSDKLRDECIDLAFVVDAASLQEVMTSSSAFRSWETLLRVTTHLHELGRADEAVSAARKKAAKAKPQTQYDTQNWYEVAPRERLAEAFEASGEERLELAGEAVDLLADVPAKSRATLASRLCRELLALGVPALAMRALSELDPKSRDSSPAVHRAQCELVRAVAVTSVSEAFRMFAALAPSKESTTYAAGVMGMRRTSSTGLELSLELLEALSSERESPKG